MSRSAWLAGVLAALAAGSAGYWAGHDGPAVSDLAGRAEGSLPTALAFLAWFVFAPQCLSTIAVARRETNGWKWPGFMLAYLFALAYAFAGLTYWLATLSGL